MLVQLWSWRIMVADGGQSHWDELQALVVVG